MDELEQWAPPVPEEGSPPERASDQRLRPAVPGAPSRTSGVWYSMLQGRPKKPLRPTRRTASSGRMPTGRSRCLEGEILRATLPDMKVEDSASRAS